MCIMLHMRAINVYIIRIRLRRIANSFEENLRLKENENGKLIKEIETLKKDAAVQSKTLRELKEILQTHVKPTGQTQLRHRAG